ncbi:MAG: hypothetical protein ACRD2T_01670 [Thermoanaerobaculia bacterium]
MWSLKLAASGLALLVAVGGSSGCKAFRGAADRGHRILDRDGLPPAKLAGYFGACGGYAVGLPVLVLLLPTYPIERLYYRSAPEHDIEMPRLLAPVEIAGGLGALITGWPFTWFRRAGDSQSEPPASRFLSP